MKSGRVLGALVLVALVGFRAAPAAAQAKDPLKEAGLTKAGDRFVLADEAPVLEGMKALRATKLEADKETRARSVVDNQIAIKRKAAADAVKEYRDLERRIDTVAKPDVRNNMIRRLNRLVSDHKAAMEAAKELETAAGKVSTMQKVKFVDASAALAPKADAVSAKYAALAADKAVMAAVARGGPKAALGSQEFADAAAELKKWRSTVESEAIPLREEHGTFTVDALLNNKPFRLSVDTGASSILLPFEVAKEIDISPTEKDPTITLRLANGSEIEGKEMILASIRVGRFTLKDVRCVVLQPGLPDPPSLLGGTFLNNFITKIDPSKNELHLTEIVAGSASKDAPATKPAK